MDPWWLNGAHLFTDDIKVSPQSIKYFQQMKQIKMTNFFKHGASY